MFLSAKNPARPNFEKTSAIAWGAMLGSTLVYQALFAPPILPALTGFLACAALGARRLLQSNRQKTMRERLNPRPAWKPTYGDIAPQLQEASDADAIWLGAGFEWDQRHTQYAKEIASSDHQSIGLIYPENLKGAPWIHGLGEQEKYVSIPFPFLGTHTLIVGTTGCGKSRTFDILINQAIRRGETTIVIDPKGDQGLRETVRRACEQSGDPERFLYYHPAFPEKSVRINPLQNFNQGNELATRICSLIGATTETDSFKSFSHKAVNAVIQGLLICKRRPTLKLVRRYLEMGTENLVIDALTAYCDRVMPSNWRDDARGVMAETNPGKKAKFFTLWYMEKVAPTFGNMDLEGLLAINEHEAAHKSKMIAGLMPLLDMLTSGDVGALLSPDANDLSDSRQVTDTMRVIRNKNALYLGLDSLSNGMVGMSVGSLILADLASTAGAIYNTEDASAPKEPVNIFIDEAAEVINDQFVQLLNKSRGAEFRLFVATQTIADFEAKAGGAAQAKVILGNINNRIVMRTVDIDTVERISKELRQVTVEDVTEATSAALNGEASDISGQVMDRVQQTPAPLIAADIFSQLPDGECFAILSGGRVFKIRMPLIQTEDAKAA